MTKLINKHQKAITLLELMLVLLIIAAILFTAIRYYANVRENAKVSEAAAQINLVVDAAYKWMAMQNQNNFCGGNDTKNCTNPINLQKLMDAGLLTKNDIKSPWPAADAQLLGLQVNENLDNPMYVNVGYNRIPKTACESLVERFKNKVVIINNKPTVDCTYQGQAVQWQFYGGF